MSEIQRPYHHPTFGGPEFSRNNATGRYEVFYTEKGSGIDLTYIIQAQSYQEYLPGELREMKVGTQIVEITMESGEVIIVDGKRNIKTSIPDRHAPHDMREIDLGHYVPEYSGQVDDQGVKVASTIVTVGKHPMLRYFAVNMTRSDSTYHPTGVVEHIKITYKAE